MGFEEYNVLIVDDDKKFAESLKQGFLRAGFRCYVVHNPEDALSYAKLQDVHVMIIDCMLPKVNGLQLVKQFQETLAAKPHLFLMSGIFKDKQFISTSTKKTGAIDFWSKPFDLGKAVKQVESIYKGIEESHDGFNPLVGLYLNRDISTRKIIKLINNTEGLHNFDLPWVFKLLMDCKATGHLNIACTNGDIAGVGFSNGDIVQVNIKNESSLLGLLLVEQGFLSRADLTDALTNNANTKLIGEYLIEANLVSPHAITIVLKDQLMWRLKRLVADSQMEVNFVKADNIATIVHITPLDFQDFVLETIETTIRPDWLKAHYLPLGENLLRINKTKASDLNKVRLQPYISRTYPSFEHLLMRGTTLDEVIANNSAIDSHVLKIIHFFNVMGFVEITNVSKTLNFNYQTKRLKKLQNELEDKNYFERLGVSRSAKEADIRKAYFDLAKVLHPDKLSESTPIQIKELSEKVFEKIQIAYETLKRSDKKQDYLESLEAGQSEKLIEGDKFLELGRDLLAQGQYSKARQHMQKAMKLNPDSPEIKIHCLWAEIKVTEQPSEKFIADIDKKLNLIPLESRDSAAYYHVRGLYHKARLDNERATKYFQTAIDMDSAFISARREMTLLSTKENATNILTADLKTVVGNLFRK